MATYWNHTRTLRQRVAYEFTCEHCGRATGILPGEISGVGSYRSNWRELSEKQSDKLQQYAEGALEREMEKAKRGEETGKFHEGFSDCCPHCGKGQSWAAKTAAGKRWPPLFVGVAFAALLLFCMRRELMRLPLYTLAAITLLPPVIGFFIGFIPYLRKMSRIKGGTTQNRPVIHWPVEEQVEVI